MPIAEEIAKLVAQMPELDEPVANQKQDHAAAKGKLTGPAWEGTGVKPDVEVASDEALERALEMVRGNQVRPAA